MSRRRRTKDLIASRPSVLSCAVIALVLAISSAAFASNLNQVVQPNGTVYGQTYTHYLKQVWKYYYKSSSPCQTTTVHGREVALAEDTASGTSTCTVPAGDPIFINSLSTPCSTLPGQHNGYGRSDSALQKCSRAVTEKALITEWLDGQRVPNFGKIFWKQVSAFSVHVPDGRFPGISHRRARVAAWGWALLLKGLPRGTHRIKCKATYPSGGTEFASTVTLKVQ
jgi:hypothetical protein